jgi:hypothetical protein
MSTPHSSSIHRIRLQGPWEWAVPTPAPEQAWTWNRLRLPEEWDRLPATTGPVWFRRRFHAPTGITPNDRIRVAITTVMPLGSVHLNGEPLPRLSSAGDEADPVIRYEMTQALTARNLLEIFFEEGISPPQLDGGLGHPVVMEIESFPTSQGA